MEIVVQSIYQRIYVCELNIQSVRLKTETTCMANFMALDFLV
jgi:hypothetical protein